MITKKDLQLVTVSRARRDTGGGGGGGDGADKYLQNAFELKSLRWSSSKLIEENELKTFSHALKRGTARCTRAPLPSILPECCAHIPLYQPIKSDFICIAQVRKNNSPQMGFTFSTTATRFFLPVTANIWGKTQKNKKTLTWKKKKCRGELQSRDASL